MQPQRTAGLCECGCGQATRLAPRTDSARGWRKGEPLRFVHRHRPPPHYTGRRNPRYNGGLTVNAEGRCYVNCRDGSVMAYSRAVMAAHLGRLLGSSEIVHHVNEDPSDDRLSNLELTTRPEHILRHLRAMLAARGL